MRTIIMISKDNAVNLAVTYSAFQDALTEFCANQCLDTAQSLLVWAGMLEALQDDLDIIVADKQQLLNALNLADKFIN